MSAMEVLDSCILYRNPVPHVYSKHAYWPSVVQYPDGEMVAAFTIGQAFEAPDLHSCIARSFNCGTNWSMEGRMYPGTESRETSDCCRIALLDGELVAFLIRHDRSREDCGLANPDNLGFVETELLLLRSADRGRT